MLFATSARWCAREHALVYEGGGGRIVNIAARPALQEELAKARRQLEHALDIVEVRGLQYQIRLLRKLIEDPKKILTPNGKEEVCDDEVAELSGT